MIYTLEGNILGEGIILGIKTKINERLTNSSQWILNNPESLSILMIMATSMASVFFGLLAAAMGFNKQWFLMALFAFFSIMAIKSFINIFKLVKKAGLKNALGGITSSEFVWHKDKDGNKLYGGVEDGKYNGTEQTDEIYNEQDVGCNEVGKEGNGTDNSKPERTNAWSSIMLERSGSDVDKDGVSKGRDA